MEERKMKSMLLVILTNTNINNKVEGLSFYQLCLWKEGSDVRENCSADFPNRSILAFIYLIDTY